MGKGDTQDCGSVQADGAGTRACSKPPRVEGRGECEGEVAGATVRPPAGPGEPCGKPGFGLGLVGIREGL